MLGDLRRGLKSVPENSSFAPLGLVHFSRTNGLRRGLHSFAASRLETAGLFHCECPKRDLTLTLEAAPFQNGDQKRVFSSLPGAVGVCIDPSRQTTPLRMTMLYSAVLDSTPLFLLCLILPGSTPPSNILSSFFLLVN